jgi:hypothetical protein
VEEEDTPSRDGLQRASWSWVLEHANIDLQPPKPRQVTPWRFTTKLSPGSVQLPLSAVTHEPAGPSFVEPPAAITTAGTCGCTASSHANHCCPPWPCTRHDELGDFDISPMLSNTMPVLSLPRPCSKLPPSSAHAKSLLLLLIAHFREDEEDISRPTCSFNKTSVCILCRLAGVCCFRWICLLGNCQFSTHTHVVT